MNKEIKALIEEACKDNSKGSFNSDSIWLQDQSFQAGASFALSLFKWRKVSEELPEMDVKVLVRTDFENVTVGFHRNVWYTDSELDDDADEIVTEWMPIPQID